MESIYKEPAIDAEGNVDGPELLLEIKRLPNGSFMLIRDRRGDPNDRIVLDARALSAIDSDAGDRRWPLHGRAHWRSPDISRFGHTSRVARERGL